MLFFRFEIAIWRYHILTQSLWLSRFGCRVGSESRSHVWCTTHDCGWCEDGTRQSHSSKNEHVSRAGPSRAIDQITERSCPRKHQLFQCKSFYARDAMEPDGLSRDARLQDDVLVTETLAAKYYFRIRQQAHSCEFDPLLLTKCFSNVEVSLRQDEICSFRYDSIVPPLRVRKPCHKMARNLYIRKLKK